MTYTTAVPKFTGRNVPITEIAKVTGKGPQFIRLMEWVFAVAAFYLYLPLIFLLDKLQPVWYYYISNDYRGR